MLAQYLDVSSNFVSGGTGTAIVELSNYDYCVVQFVTLSGATASFKTTLDSGAVEGSTDGNALTANNYLDVYGVDITSSTNALVKSLASGNGIIRFPVVGRYLKIGGTNCLATKVLVMLTKIS